MKAQVDWRLSRTAMRGDTDGHASSLACKRTMHAQGMHHPHASHEGNVPRRCGVSHVQYPL
eukprot:358495-Chlamydomonas_euryale.AAC.6